MASNISKILPKGVRRKLNYEWPRNMFLGPWFTNKSFVFKDVCPLRWDIMYLSTCWKACFRVTLFLNWKKWATPETILILKLLIYEKTPGWTQKLRLFIKKENRVGCLIYIMQRNKMFWHYTNKKKTQIILPIALRIHQYNNV